MKIHTILLLIIAKSVVAGYPEDLVSSDAMAVLSLKNANSINSTFESIQSQLSATKEKPDVLDAYLGQFLVDPSAVDLSEKVLLALQPTILEAGQRPAGMFGPMPHLVFICKPIEGRKIEIKPGMLKTGGMYGGWFVASGSDSWSAPDNFPSQLFDQLPTGQVGLAADFETIWKQFGPITQMMGGMMIGTMNKPGPTGVIDPTIKRQSAAASVVFRKVMTFCSNIKILKVGIQITENKISNEVNLTMSDSEDISIDNSDLENMSSILSGETIQYGMSGGFTRLLMEYELDSLASIGDFSEELPMMVITKSMQELAKIQEDNVVSYSLSGKSGLSVSALAITSNQSEYLSLVPLIIDEAALELKDKFFIQLIQNNTSSNSWDIKMLGQDEEDLKIMESVFPNDVQFKFGVQGSDKIFLSIGPKSYRPFIQPHSSPLSQLLKNNKDIAVDFAFATDVRKLASGFIDIAIAAGSVPAEDAISSAPSANVSFVLGRDSNGWRANYDLDLLGFARLVQELESIY